MAVSSGNNAGLAAWHRPNIGHVHQNISVSVTDGRKYLRKIKKVNILTLILLCQISKTANMIKGVGDIIQQQIDT